MMWSDRGCLLLLLFLPAATGGVTVTTIAGNGFKGSAEGDSKISRLNLPGGVALSPDGRVIVVADQGNHMIRKIEIGPNGWSNSSVTPGPMMKTLAGSGVGGSKDGQGTNAEFNRPMDVAFSIDGSWVAVADTGNNLIRKVLLATGQVTTLAGGVDKGYKDGVGTNAEFVLPSSLAFNEKGDALAIADTGNHRIRWMSVATSAVTTLAGSKIKAPACGFGRYKSSGACPNGRCLCGAINTLDFVSAECARVEYDLGAGTPTLLCHYGTSERTCTKADSTTQGCACERPNTGTPCSSDAQCNLGGRCVGMGGYEDGVATMARFNGPTGISVHDNTVYVADSQNQVVRAINVSSGLVTTLAGNAQTIGTTDGLFNVQPSNDPNVPTPTASHFSTPFGIAVFKGQWAVVADGDNFKIRRLDLAEKMVRSVTGWMTCRGGSYTVFGFCWTSAKCLCNETRGDALSAAQCADGSPPTDTPADDTPHCQCLSPNTQQSCITSASCIGGGTCSTVTSKGFVDGEASSAKFAFPSDVALNAAGTLIVVADQANHAVRVIDCGGPCNSDDATVKINTTLVLGLKMSRAERAGAWLHLPLMLAASSLLCMRRVV